MSVRAWYAKPRAVNGSVAARMSRSPFVCHALGQSHFPYGYSSKREIARSLGFPPLLCFTLLYFTLPSFPISSHPIYCPSLRSAKTYYRLTAWCPSWVTNALSTFTSKRRNLMGHFRAAFCLCIKTSLGSKPFTWKYVSFSCTSNSFSYQRFCMKTRFETEAMVLLPLKSLGFGLPCFALYCKEYVFFYFNLFIPPIPK